MLTLLPLVVDEDVAAFSFVRIGKRSHRDLSTLLVTIKLRAPKGFCKFNLEFGKHSMKKVMVGWEAHGSHVYVPEGFFTSSVEIIVTVSS